MIEERRTKKIDLCILSWGVALCMLAVPFMDRSIFLGMLSGAIIGFVNWLGLKYLMARVIAGHNKARWGILLAAKFILILAVVTAVIFYLPVNVIAFGVGVSSLILGILTYTLLFAGSNEEQALKEDF